LHEGVKWHDGQPFTARDVKCTWDLLQGETSERCATVSHGRRLIFIDVFKPTV
jgi:peptide/nickel transport system substrate-binding protein